jgi:cellulose synthase operon protein C
MLRSALSTEVDLDSRFFTVDGERSELIYGGLARGAQHNNLALALSNVGDDEEAIATAREARRRDPASPIFRDTLGYSLHRAGETDAAVRLYRSALASDPTSYISAANLGVLLASKDPGSEQARRLLDQAIRANPDYALAWHNLGVVQSQTWSPLDYLRGQRSLGQARRLDRDLREAGLSLQPDLEIYESGLDVSAPLPPDWSYGESATERGHGLAWTLVLLLLLRVAWSLGLDRLSGHLVAVSGANQHRSPWWSRARPAAWALALSLAILVWAGVRELRWSFGMGVGLAVVIAVVAVPLALRRAAGRGLDAHQAWPPGMAVGGVLSLFGLMFVPYPALRDESVTSARVRWVGPIALTVVGVLFVALSLVTAVPLSGLVAATSIAVLGSMLTPIPPFDGAELRGRVLNACVSAGLAGATVLAALNLA